MEKGRPTLYTPELIEKAWNYAKGGWIRSGDQVPSVAGLACEIGITRETCYAWAKDETKIFSDILGLIAQTQERMLINGGLSGQFNSPITKVMLGRHGYTEAVKADHTSSDGSMTPKAALDVSKLSTEALKEIVAAAGEAEE